MDEKLLLMTAIVLLFRESLLAEKIDNSIDLVKTVVQNIKSNDNAISMPDYDVNVVSALKQTALSMCGPGNQLNVSGPDLLEQLKLNCGQDDRLYDLFESALTEQMSEKGLKISVVHKRTAIVNHFREQKISEVLAKASYMFKFKRSEIPDVNGFLDDISMQLDSIRTKNSLKDPAVMAEIDFDEPGSLDNVFTNIKEQSNGAEGYIFGFTEANEMVGGKLGSKDFMMVPSLSHNYKTGFVNSLYMQMVQYNKPRCRDADKKPLALLIKFEDKPEKTLKFFYEYLKYDETRDTVDIKNVSDDEMKRYVSERLKANGFHIKILRVNPSEWTIKSYFNKIIELEAQGYFIEFVVMDYLAKMPTTGCVSSGPIGTDMRDMVKRAKNFGESKLFPTITPHQLSTQVQKMLQNGTPAEAILFQIFENHLTEGSNQLVQEVDIMLYLMKVYKKDRYWLHLHWGKTRDFVIPKVSQSAYLQFPEDGMPIPSNIHNESHQIVRKITGNISNADESLFKLG